MKSTEVLSASKFKRLAMKVKKSPWTMRILGIVGFLILLALSAYVMKDTP